MGVVRQVTGTFEAPGDDDWFHVYLEAGKTYEFTGTIVGGATGPTIRVMQADGTLIPQTFPISNVYRFTASYTGDYLVSAIQASGGSDASTYQLQVVDYADPIKADASTSSSLAVNGSQTATYSNSFGFSDQDWYAVDLIAGQSYQLASSSAGIRVYFADASGALLAPAGQQSHFTALTSGRFFAGIQYSGSYTISLTAVADDYGTSAGAAGALSIGGSVAGNWEAIADSDWFSVSMTAGKSYDLSVATGSPFSFGYVSVFDAAGKLVTTTSTPFSGSEPQAIFSPMTSGTFYLAATHVPGGNPPGAYTLSAAEVAGDLPDNVLTQGMLTIGAPAYSGSWEGKSDADWLAVNLSAGQSYLFTLGASTPSGVQLGLYDLAGNLLQTSPGTTMSGTVLHHTAASNGTYFIGAVNGRFASSQSYSLSASAVADDLPNNPATTGSIVVGSTASGISEASGDTDWFAVTLNAGVTYRLTAGSGSPGLTLVDAAGVSLSDSPGFGDQVYSVATSGTYYVAASANPGVYDFSISFGFDDHREDAQTLGAFRVTVSGTTGADTLSGVSPEYEAIVASDGADTIIAGNGYDSYNGGGGIDTLSFSNYAVGAEVSLAQGRTFEGGRTRHIVSQIENLIGSSFADTLTGNSQANRIEGGSGNDFINGGTGADTMIGGSDNDIYLVDNIGDIVTELAGEGTDEVRTGLGSSTNLSQLYVLPSNVENLTGTSAAGQGVRGNALDNVIAMGAGNDLVWLMDGGDDNAIGGDGNDVFLFGAAMTSLDLVSGGAGTDQIALQGNYGGGLTFGAGVIGIENLAILPGSDPRFGDTAGNFYDYNLTLVDANVAAGVQMVVDANRLRLGEDFTFNGSAETDGSFFIYGGGGVDNLNGGAKNDVFLFGAQGQWGASDVVDGGPGGIDQLALRGDYTITFGATQLVGIEQIALVSALDTRFGALGDRYDYNLTMNDGNVVGIQLTVDAAALRADETLVFNGSAEDDGSFRVFGGAGNDVITGSQNADIIVGGLRGDTLTGGGGNDIFRYNSVEDSNSTERDGIQDFNAGDLIDLSRIDANTLLDGDQVFTFVGNAAFSKTAGELRFENLSNGGPIWLVQGDTDGDGVSDFEVVLVISPPDPITAGDFIL